MAWGPKEDGIKSIPVDVKTMAEGANAPWDLPFIMQFPVQGVRQAHGVVERL